MRIRDCHIAILENKYDVLNSYLNDIKQTTFKIISTPLENCTQDMIDDMCRIIDMANKVYNETTLDSIIDDDEYDLLIQRYTQIFNEVPIGKTENSTYMEVGHKPTSVNEFEPLFTQVNRKDYIFADAIIPVDEKLYRSKYTIDMNIGDKGVKKANMDQLYPELVGTLGKCKYVLFQDASGVGTDEAVFERDFIAKHIKSGIYDKNRQLSYMLQLKYDGISVVATIKNGKIIQASSRGDISNNKAEDYTPILYGYTFPNAVHISDEIGVKFEAIITYSDLERYNKETGSDFKNCRTGISSIFARDNGRRYQKYITLVPLDMNHQPHGYGLDNRVAFLNEYFANTIKNEGAIMVGNYVSLLYQVDKFLKEAEALRNYSYFMYDGIVFSYLDEDIVDALGRIGSINQYQMAIKFKADTKLTKFTGYSYTIGKDGRITPMINYEPVMFIGTYHTKSSGHSYGRFKELNLRKGDTIAVEYRNDVMPYVSVVDNQAPNPNPPEEFISHCPACGNRITISDSGKTAICNNIQCSGRAIKRLAGFFEALNIKNFSEAYLQRLGVIYLADIYNMSTVELARRFNSDVLADKFRVGLNEGLNNRFDYELMGALGFTSMGSSKWKTILSHMTIIELIKLMANPNLALNTISNIKGVGLKTATTVIEEYPLFEKDINFIRTLKYKEICKEAFRKSVRFSGVRDSSFIQVLNNIGFDASGTAGLTKDTDILVIPYNGFTSSKVKKAEENGTLIVPIAEFKENPGKYL